MKKLFALIFLLTLNAQTAHGAQNPIPAAELTNPNLIQDPGFENNGYGWTASGGATKTANTTAKGTGTKGYDWDSNSGSQTLDTASITIPTGYYGRNGLAYCAIKTPSGSATHTLTVYDGSNNIVTPATITSSTSFVRSSVNFVFPSSGSVKLRFTSVSSNEPEIYIDNCYLGLADNLSNVSQVQFIGSAYIATTVSCTWSRANTALGAFGTTSACPGPTVESNPGPGTIQTTDTDLPKFTVNALPPGTYRVIISAEAGISGGTNHNSYTISDGTNTSGRGNGSQVSNGAYAGMTIEGWFTYSDSGNRTFELYGSAVGNTASIDNAAGNNRTQFSIVRFPPAPEQAYRPDMYPSSWSGYHDNTCSFARTNTAIGDFTADSTCVFGEVTNRNFGTVTSYLSGSDKLPGIVFTPPRAGRYFACVTSRATMSSTGQAYLALADDGTVIASTENRSSSTDFNATVCGIINATSTSAKTVSLRGGLSSGTITVGASSVTGRNAVDWSIFAIDQAFPMPLLSGSVTSNSVGLERIERAELNCDASSSITSQSGTWLSAIGNRSTAACTITIAAGIFSATPACTFTVKATAVQATAVNMTSATAGTVYGASSDYDGYLICMGSR